MTIKTLPLLTRLGNPDTINVGSVWQPWPQADLWEILADRSTDDAYLAESLYLSRWLHGHPPPESGELRSKIEYDTYDVQRFDLTDSSLYFRWRPAINEDTDNPDYYMRLRLHDTEDGDNDVTVDAEVEISAGGAPDLEQQTPQPTMPGFDGTGQTLAWDPTGTYLIVGGGGDSFGGENIWAEVWKYDGSALSYLGHLPDLPGNPYEIQAAAWDPTGTYVVVGYYRDDGSLISLYRRSGDTFSLVSPQPTQPGDNHASDYVYDMDWVGNYLAVAFDANASPNKPLALYSWDSGAETLTLEDHYLDGGTAEAVAWDPTGTYLAAVTWYGTDQLRLLKRSGDSLSELTAPTSQPYYPPRTALDWDATGTYLLVGQYTQDGTDLAFYKLTGDALTGLTAPTLLTDDAVYSVAWHPDGDTVLVGYKTSNDPEIKLYERTGDTLTVSSDTYDQPDDTYAYGTPEEIAWHPDGDLVVVSHAQLGSGPWITSYTYDGGEAGPQLKITVQDNDPVIVSPYDPDTHAWLRVRHMSSGNRILVDTAEAGCGTWVNRADKALGSGDVVTKLGIAMISWVDSHAGETERPSVGFFGPFNPEGSEYTLPLLTRIGRPLVADTELTLPLLTEIGDVA